MKKKLIAIVGLPASGKSTAINAVKEFGTIITMGDVVREETQRRSLNPTPQNMGAIAQSLREELGDDIIARRCMEKINSLQESIILIDGIRSEHEVDLFREHLPLYVIAITCSNSIRFERIQKRGRSDDTKNMEKIKERDMRELGFGLGAVIENADYTIPNNLDVQTLEKRVRNLVQGLL
jgi:dephospho-CoA kinase